MSYVPVLRGFPREHSKLHDGAFPLRLLRFYFRLSSKLVIPIPALTLFSQSLSHSPLLVSRESSGPIH